MRTLVLIAIYVASFIIIFLMLSCIVFIYVRSYNAVLTHIGWQIMYTVCIGWWLAAIPTREYYLIHEEYFDRVF
jgi:hypothetical protein